MNEQWNFNDDVPFGSAEDAAAAALAYPSMLIGGELDLVGEVVYFPTNCLPSGLSWLSSGSCGKPDAEPWPLFPLVLALGRLLAFDTEGGAGSAVDPPEEAAGGGVGRGARGPLMRRCTRESGPGPKEPELDGWLELILLHGFLGAGRRSSAFSLCAVESLRPERVGREGPVEGEQMR